MKTFSTIDLTAIDLRTLSDAERAAFHKEVIRRAHAARAQALRDFFRAIRHGFRRRPQNVHKLLPRRAVAVLVLLGAVSAAAFAFAGQGVGNGSHISAPAVHADTNRVQERFHPATDRQLTRPTDCSVTDAIAYLHKGCTPAAL